MCLQWHNVSSLTVYIHFGPWSLRSLVTSVLSHFGPTTEVHIHFGPWSVRSSLGHSHFGPLLSHFGPEMGNWTFCPQTFCLSLFNVSCLFSYNPSTIVWVFLTTHVTVCACHSKLLTYQGQNVFGAHLHGANWQRGEMSTHPRCYSVATIQHHIIGVLSQIAWTVTMPVAYTPYRTVMDGFLAHDSIQHICSAEHAICYLSVRWVDQSQRYNKRNTHRHTMCQTA